MIISEYIGMATKIRLKSTTATELVSGPGIGKTSAEHAVAAALSRLHKQPYGIVTVILSDLDAPDIRGFLMPVKDNDELWARFTRPTVFPNKWNTKVYVDGLLVPDYAATGGPMPKMGYIFFDEFGQADMSLQKPCGQVLLERQLGDYTLGEWWRVGAASNRIEDRSGVVKRAMFLQNRMKVLNIAPSLQAWTDWALLARIHPLGISYANKHWSDIGKDFIPKGVDGPFGTPRSLVLCLQDLEALREKEHGLTRLPDDHIATEIAQGWLGEGTAAVFLTHIRLANDLPEISDIEKNPLTTKVPDRVDARYVMASTLPHHITRKNGGAFVKYVSRMDAELQILFVTQSIRRGPEALNIPEFQQWVQKNTQLAMAAFG